MEGGLDRIAQAKGAMARNDFANKGVFISKAIGIVGGLREGLNLEPAKAWSGRTASITT